MRSIGILLLVIGCLVGGVAWLTLDNAKGDAARMMSLEQFDPDETDVGDRIWADARAKLGGGNSTAPMSGDEFAWWSHSRELQYEVEEETCTTDGDGHEDCDTTWDERSKSLQFETSSLSILVQAADTDLMVRIPQADAGIKGSKENRRKEKPAKDRGFDYRNETEVETERVVKVGRRVLVMGEVTRIGDENIGVEPVDQLRVVHAGTSFAREQERVDEMAGKADVFRTLGLGVAGVGLLVLLASLVSGGSLSWMSRDTDATDDVDY